MLSELFGKQTAQPSGALSRYLHYVGWYFGEDAADYDAASARLIGDQGPYTYVVAKRGARFRYALFDSSGTVHRVVVHDGTQTVSSRDGRAFSPLPDHQAFILKAEVAAFFTDFRGYTIAAADRNDPNRVTLQADTENSVDIEVSEDGACRAIAINTVRGSEYLVPLQVTKISPHHRIYATWRRNGEVPIRFQRFDATAKVYAGEVTVPETSRYQA
jgi:hypothetical protein